MALSLPPARKKLTDVLGGFGQFANRTGQVIGGTVNNIIGEGIVNPVLRGGRELTNLSNATNPYNAQIRANAQPVNYRQLLSDAATTGLNAATLGTGRAIMAAPTLAKQALRGAGQGTLYGGAYGGVESFRQNATPIQTAKNVATGAAIGGVVGGAVPVVSRAITPAVNRAKVTLKDQRGSLGWEDMNSNDAAKAFGRAKGIVNTKPAHQEAIEAAMAKGDTKTVASIIQGMDDADPYKQSMLNLFKDRIPELKPVAKPTVVENVNTNMAAKVYAKQAGLPEPKIPAGAKNEKGSMALFQSLKREDGGIRPGADMGGGKPPKPPVKMAQAEPPGKGPKPLNTARLKLTDTEKARVTGSQNPIAEQLSNREVQDIARNAGIDTKTYTVDQTRQKIAKQLNARQQVVSLERQYTQLEQAGATPAELAAQRLKIAEAATSARTQGTDVARQLQARRIIADELQTPMQRVFRLLDEAGVNPKIYAEKSVGVDFNDGNAVVKFYRSLAPATASDWIDVIRYNSMLSSPLTQIINATNTSQNVALAPIERGITTALDALKPLFGRERSYAGGEGRAMAAGMAKSFPDAVRDFKRVFSGRGENLNIELGTRGGHIPVKAVGESKAVDLLTMPTRLLASFDAFNKALVRGGSDAALAVRQKAGIRVLNPEAVSTQEAAYRTFNREIGDASQGYLLRGLDEITSTMMKWRASKNPVVSYPSKFAMPFVRIGANLLKQGVEYSPAGLATLPGAADKTAQLSKALIGMSVASVAGGLLGQGRLTWAEPTSAAEKDAFRAAGKQPYSVKVGNNWYSFAKLPPFVSANLALIAALDDAQKNSGLEEDALDEIMTAFASAGHFLADQSYLKSFGDALAAIGGDDEAKVATLGGNFAQQLIPGRAFTGWLARMTDTTQRRINTDAGFVAKQLESVMQQYPGLRQMTTERLGPDGEPLAAQHPVLNSFSQVRTTTEDPRYTADYEALRDKRISNAQLRSLNKQEKTKPTPGSGYRQLPDGSFTAKIDGEYKKFDSANEAQFAVAKDEFMRSGEKSRVVGDTYLYKTKSGDVRQKPKVLYDWEQADAKLNLTMDRAYETGNLAAWMGAAQQKYDALEKKKGLYDPETEADEIDKITLAQENLIQKAQGYAEKGIGGRSAGRGTRVSTRSAAISTRASGRAQRPTVSVPFTNAPRAVKRVATGKPRVSIKRSLV